MGDGFFLRNHVQWKSVGQNEYVNMHVQPSHLVTSLVSTQFVFSVKKPSFTNIKRNVLRIERAHAHEAPPLFAPSETEIFEIWLLWILGNAISEHRNTCYVKIYRKIFRPSQAYYRKEGGGRSPSGSLLLLLPTYGVKPLLLKRLGILTPSYFIRWRGKIILLTEERTFNSGSQRKHGLELFKLD